MTFNELNEHWNELHNAAMGRGTQPLVSSALASEVNAGWERWRKWLKENGGVLEDTFATRLVAADWIHRWESLAARVRAEGQAVPDMPQSLIHDLTQGVQSIGKGIVIVLGAVAAAALAIALARKSRR